MLDAFRRRLGSATARIRRVERREARDLRRWLAHTPNLVHVSILVFVPLLVGLVTYVSNSLVAASFLLYPPLASGTYTLFADPGGKYSSPPRFVGGMTLGALAGWVALELTARYWYNVPPGQFQANAGAAALGILLTVALTWALDLEQPTAFSTALLVLLFAGEQTYRLAGVVLSSGLTYVLAVAASSTLVALVFVVWREEFYHERARYLYETTRGDDHVLVPMRGEDPGTVAMFGARLAAAHEAGKVVLLDVVDDRAVAARERELLDRLVGVGTGAAGELAADASSTTADGADGAAPDGATADRPADGTAADAAARTAAERLAAKDRVRPAGGESTALDASGRAAGQVGEDVSARSGEQAEADASPRPAEPVADDVAARAEEEVAATAVERLEREASRIETRVGVPVDVVVAVDGTDSAGVVLATARETNCDLVVTPYETELGSLSPFVRALFASDVDVVALRASGERDQWRRIMVPVRGAGDVAHAMIDFGLRLAGRTGTVSACRCIDTERSRRRAEELLSRLVESFSGQFETRVARREITDFIAENAPHYDLTVIGASTDRSAASRFISPPTFERLEDVDCDVAVVHTAR